MSTRSFFALLLLSSGLLAGCHSQAIESKANSELDAIHTDTENLLMEPSCFDGAPLRSRCGMLTKRVAMQDFRQTFAQKKCAGDTTETCQLKFDRAVAAWLVQRYPLADHRTIEIDCDANPGVCDDPQNHERLLLDSHNRAARTMDARREEEVIARREMEHRTDDAQTLDAALLGVEVVSMALSAGSHHHHHHHYRW